MDISLIIPIYGAESFLRQSLAEIDGTLSQTGNEKWELLLVIDASPDKSLEICREFASTPRSYKVKIIVNEENFGKGATVRLGMLAATGNYRIFNDCDLAYPMSEVLKILDALKSGGPAAIASRGCEESRYIFSPTNFRYLYTRHVASHVLNFLIQRTLLPVYRDTQAGLKGFNAAVTQFLFSQLKLDGFSFDLELLYLAAKAGITVTEVPIHFYAQRVTTLNVPLESLRMLRDIFLIYYWKLRGKYNFSFTPEVHEKVSHSC